MEQGSILSFFKRSRPDLSRPESSRPGQPHQRPSTTHHSRHKSSHSRHKSSHSKHNSKSKHKGPNNRRNMDRQKIAEETISILPIILSNIPTFAANVSSIHNLDSTPPLDPALCPGIKNGATIKVLDMDTFDAALVLQDYSVSTHLSPSGDATAQDTDTQPTPTPPRPVAVLNLASEYEPGGGWKRGALAQEECLCYRSSLYLSLHDSYYPLPSLSAIYSPDVVVIRDSMAAGHALLPSNPEDLPALSVISVAALRSPAVSDDGKTFRDVGARAETKRKIRIVLRVAATQGHTKLVLGALGCGVFQNPPTDVAHCFLEVLREKEFQGGWWEEIAFAVLDNTQGPHSGKDGSGNYGQFCRMLDGRIV